MSYISAITLIRLAAVAAFIAATATTVTAWRAFVLHEEWVNIFYFGDSALLLLLGVGVWLRSRLAAVLLLAYWIFSKIVQFENGSVFARPSDWLIAAFFFAVFVAGLVGSVICHRRGLG